MLVIGMFVLSIVSGMLGLGVAFVAVPFLSLFFPDVVHQVQPLSLLLNGATAASSALGFARSKLVDWRTALPLAAVTTASAPLGALLAQRADARVVWVLYFGSVAWLAIRLFRPTPAGATARWEFGVAGLLVAAGVAGAFLGAQLTTRYVGGAVLKRVFAVLIVAVTAYRLSSLV